MRRRAAAVALLLGLVAACREQAPAKAGSTTAVRTTTRSPTPARFTVGSVSFLDADHGWALGDADGLALKETRDGGRSWRTLPAPPARWLFNPAPGGPRPVVQALQFADDEHGYLYGTSLLATSDGGLTWSVVPAVAHVTALVIASGHAVALTAALTGRRLPLRTATIGSDVWTTHVTPARGRVVLVAAGESLVLLQTGSRGGIGRLWTSTDLGAHWSSRSLPCSVGSDWAGDVGASYGRSSEWYVDCYNDDESSQHVSTQHRLWVTADAGLHWSQLGQPTRRGYPDTLTGSGRHVLLTTSSGRGDVMSGSADGGRHWSDLFADGGEFFGWQGPTFVTAEVVYAVGPTHYATEHLYRSTDGGTRWSRIDTSG